MSNTSKLPTSLDQTQVMQNAFNPLDSSLSTSGFLAAKVGRKVEVAVSTTSSTGDTLTYSLTESGTALATYVLIYTDNTYAVLVSAERTA